MIMDELALQFNAVEVVRAASSFLDGNTMYVRCSCPKMTGASVF